MVSSSEFARIKKFSDDAKLSLCPFITVGRDGDYFFMTHFEIRQFPTAIVYDKKGKSATLNSMIPLAKYDYIAILDVDDIWFPTKLEQQVPFVLQGYDVIGTKCVYFGERFSGTIPNIPTGDISSVDFFQTNPIINSSSIIKKELCEWDGDLDLEDYDLWLRLRGQNRRFYNCPEVLVKHRIHSASAFNSKGNANRVPELLQKHRKRSQIRIRIFSSFGVSDNCKAIYERLCEIENFADYGPDKRVFIVNDDSYTHAVILNTAQPALRIPKENVIGFAFEPPVFLQLNQSFVTYARNHIGKYYIGDSTGLPPPFISGYCYQWHITPPKREPVKNKLMSIMVSEKQNAPGHKYRHQLVKAILSTNYNIDIYGRGCRLYNQMDPRIKGEFTDDEPYENYMFHICIENFSLPNYTSEKYTNTLLWSTVPIYWGATNIIFPEETIRLSGDIIKDITLIRNIIREPESFQRKIQQDKVKSTINFLQNVANLY
jgi:glycosyltransferase involved in cell wall biosynthesis